MNLHSACDCSIVLSIRDIVEISFKPVMLEIASIISSSLVNENFFGNYINIEYLYSMISFNHNPQFQIILSSLLNEELDRLNEVQGVDTICLAAPEIPDLFLHQRSMTCHSFRHGDLHQISNENLGFSVKCIDNGVYEDIGPFYKDKKANKESFNCKDMAFVLLKKDDTITYPGVERVIYFKPLVDEKVFRISK